MLTHIYSSYVNDSYVYTSQKTSLSELRVLSTKHPEFFSLSTLLFESMRLMFSYSYRYVTESECLSACACVCVCVCVCMYVCVCV
jgi:hypothetical protein